MLHGIINEQGHLLDVRDDISEKMNIFRMFPYWSLNLRNKFIGGHQADGPLLKML